MSARNRLVWARQNSLKFIVYFLNCFFESFQRRFLIILYILSHFIYPLIIHLVPLIRNEISFLDFRALVLIRKADFNVAVKPDVFVSDKFEHGSVPFCHTRVSIRHNVESVVEDARDAASVIDEVVAKIVAGRRFGSCPAFLESDAHIWILKKKSLRFLKWPGIWLDWLSLSSRASEG